jgi:precorrin-2 dehydrogenase/sirohydrochlorin ferrochelatase
MSQHYPIFLHLTNRPVVVVGGGSVAARKVTALREAGARVRVVSPEFQADLAARDDIERHAGSYDPDALRDAVLVFACTDNPAVNARVAADARQAGIWCNVADDPDAGDFSVPATLRHGNLTIAVSTGGAAPALAAAVRDRIASHLEPDWAILVEEFGRARQIVREQVHDARVRRDILNTLCSECSIKLLATRDRESWRRWFQRVLAHRLAGKTDPPIVP